MAGRTGIDFELRTSRARSRPEEETPMRILVLGEFSGAAERRRPSPIDVDSFERVMTRMSPRLELRIAGDEGTLEFGSIDDFHPDRLYRRLGLFQRVRTDAAARIAAGEPDAQAFTRLVGAAPAAAAPRPPAMSAAEAHVQALLREAVAPHIVPDAPHQALYSAALDAAVAEPMRALLQNPRFKALEARWRGLYWLVSNLETGEELQIHVLDAAEAGAPSALQAALAGEERWSLVVADCAFGPAAEDLARLAALGAIAAQARSPLLAAARPELVGCASFAAAPDPRDWTSLAADAAERWNALRESGAAQWIGLAAPRMLLRLPYGKASDPIEAFAFEELAHGRSHEGYLWGNGALACALLIGRAYAERGWDMEPGDELEVDDLPAHTYEDDGEKRMQPCAEAPLGERAGEALLEAGLMPLLSRKDRNAVRLLRFQSIAKPAQPLAGPWG